MKNKSHVIYTIDDMEIIETAHELGYDQTLITITEINKIIDHMYHVIPTFHMELKKELKIGISKILGEKPNKTQDFKGKYTKFKGKTPKWEEI